MPDTTAGGREFELVVTGAKPCKKKLKKGDLFIFQNEIPAGFCSRTEETLRRLCDDIRAGGVGVETDFICADGRVRFHLTAKFIG